MCARRNCVYVAGRYSLRDEEDAQTYGGQAPPEDRSIAGQRNVPGLLRERLEDEAAGVLVERPSHPDKEVQHSHCSADDLGWDRVFKLA